MSKKVLMLMAIVLVFSACELQAAVTHSTWVGGKQGEWANASNWDPAIVPDNSAWRTFAVTIDAGSGEVEVNLQQSRTINQLDWYANGELEISTFNRISLTLDDPNGLTNHGRLHIGGDGKWNILGQVTNADNAKLEFWWVEIEGSLYNSPDAELYLGSHFEIEGDIFENDGSLLIQPTCSEVTVGSNFLNVGQIHLHGNPVFAGSFENKGVVRGFGFIYSKGIFQNEGTIRNETGTTFQVNVQATDPNNNGIIEVNPSGAVTFDRNIVNDPNGVIHLLGGTLSAPAITQKAEATLQGFGTIRGDIFIDPNGIIRLTGPTNIVGDVTIEHNAVLEISDGQTLIVGHTTNNGEIRVVNGNVVFQGGYSGNGIVKKE